MRTLTCLLALLALAGCAHNQVANAPIAAVQAEKPGEITTQELEYKSGDTTLKGFLAYPTGSADKRPGVLVMHEWWGLNDYARSRAKQLAELGYVALAADMYGDGKSSEHPEDAKAMMTALMSNPEQAVARFEAAKNALASDPHVDPSRLAAIGYCMGGAATLAAMRRGDDFDLVASFHGNYATPAPLQPGVFKGKVFVAHGGDDSFVTPEQVQAMQKELKDAGADYEFVSYPGAKHGFTNPHATELGQKAGIPIAYDAEADAQSWAKLQELLSRAFTQS
ncbi:MAG TPA: dienelactone hydrolase family protein [Polyangiales bacterium]